jgi:hypothetical protein
VKVVFRDKRVGKPTDIFAVPVSELKAAQRKKRGLLESELDWTSAKTPTVPKPTKRAKEDLSVVMDQLQDLGRKAAKSTRAQNDLAGWKRTIQVKTGFPDQCHNCREALDQQECRIHHRIQAGPDPSIR